MELPYLFGENLAALLNASRFDPLKDQKGRFQSNVRSAFPYECTQAMRLCSRGEGVR